MSASDQAEHDCEALLARRKTSAIAATRHERGPIASTFPRPDVYSAADGEETS